MQPDDTALWQDLAVAECADRELIPMEGGLPARVAYEHEQIRRRREGLEPLPEEGVLWRRKGITQT